MAGSESPLTELARSIVELAQRWSGAAAALLAWSAEGHWQTLAALPQGPIPTNSGLDALFEDCGAEGSQRVLRRWPLERGERDAAAVALALGRRARLALIFDAGRAPPLPDALKDSLALWTAALMAESRAELRTRDPETGLLRFESLRERLASSSGSLLLIRWPEAAAGHAARRRFANLVLELGLAEQSWRVNRDTIAVLLDGVATSQAQRIKDELDRKLGPAGAELDFGLGLAEASDSHPNQRFLRAAQALSLSRESGGPELVVLPERNEPGRRRTSGSLRRGTASLRKSADSTAEAALSFRSLDVEGESFTLLLDLVRPRDGREETLRDWLQTLSSWLGLEQGLVRRQSRDSDWRVDAQIGGELAEIPPLLGQAARARGRAQLIEENGRRWVALALRDAGDVELLLCGSTRSAIPAMQVELLGCLRPLFESRLELFRCRQKSERREKETQRLDAIPETKSPSRTPVEPGRYPRIIGSSPVIRRITAILDRFARTELPVLLQGETGTGKEVLARSIHENSRRVQGPFISLNCSAITETLMESELFGHVKGAFTGAEEDKAGYFERADGGTILLDEVQDMPAQMQSELLRVLEEREVQRVGASRAKKIDVRVIAAANRNLKDLVAAGLFRRDLYFRLNVVIIELPPLRQRREDIPELVEHALASLCTRYEMPSPQLSEDAIEELLRHDWPGNIRELINVLEKSLLLMEGSRLKASDLQIDHQIDWDSPRMEQQALPHYKDAKEQFSREYLKACLSQHEGHVTKAAETAGLTRSAFHKLLKKYQLSSGDFSATN